jgi:hypothetical protein
VVVSFVSDASNLVNDDSNGVPDVFTHDFASGVTTRESLAPTGRQLAAGGANPLLTANGRYVAFASGGSVYVRDRSAGKTSLAFFETRSVSASPSPSVSGDGRYVVFVTGNNETYFHDLLGGDTKVLNYDFAGHNSYTAYVAPRVASDGHLFFQRSRQTGTLVGTRTSITFYGADRTRMRELLIQVGSYLATDALEPPSLAGDTITYATTASLVTSDTNGDYDVYLDRPDLTGPLSPPVNLAFSLSGSTLTLRWTPPAVGVPTGYVIEIGSSPGAADLGSVRTGPAITYVTTIPTGVRFYVRVRATDASGTSNPSNEVVVSGAPGTPVNLSASVNGSGVALTWNAPESGGPASRYTISISNPFACAFSSACPPPEPVMTTSATSVSVNGVPNATYYVMVTASNDSGSSAASNMAIVSVDGRCTTPAPPSGLIANVSGSQVTLTWTGGAGATSYLLQAGSGSGRNDLVSTDLGSAATSFASAGVPAGTYFVSLRSLSACGTSVASNEVLVTVR